MGETLSKEIDLANKLKSICEDGKEKDPIKSSEILHEFGLLYQKKSPDRVSLIRSVAFLNAACIRQPSNDLFSKSLKSLCSHVLTVAKATNPDADLVEIANRLYKKIVKMRNTAFRSLRKVASIPMGLPEEQKIELEKEKIQSVKELQLKITEDYIDLMDSVTKECAKICSSPPCKYSVTGMGSLARKEITPFSDFEHIIVLEEGVHRWENYEEILEYFRWFTVIFHIIVINFKETILRSVAIPLLNDGFVKEGDWFYDVHTPCGIKFDGMQIHANKFPLGRIWPTEKHPGTPELIRPVSEMVKYLNAEDDELKYGYHLADVLTQTCFVSGSREVHDQFETAVNKYLQDDKKAVGEKQVFSQLGESLKEFRTLTKIQDLVGFYKFDVKRMIYRGSTIFISALGRWLFIEESSCFDIVETMVEKRLLNKRAAHQLAYCVAIACEVRCKIYLENNGQDDIFGKRDHYAGEGKTQKQLQQFISEQSLFDYFTTIHCLQLSIQKFNDDHLPWFDMEILNKLECTMEVKFILLRTLDLKNLFDLEWKKYQQKSLNDKPTNDNVRGLIWAALTEHARRNLHGALDYLNYLAKQEVDDHKLRCDIVRIRGGLLYECDQCEEGVKYMEDNIDMIKRLNIPNPNKTGALCHIYMLLGNCKRQLKLFTEALTDYEKCLEYYNQIDTAIDDDDSIKHAAEGMLGTCECWLHFNLTQQAIDFAAQALKLYTEADIPHASSEFICEYFNLAGRCHFKLKDYKLAREYFHKELSFLLESLEEEDQEENEQIANCMMMILKCDKALKKK